MNEGEELRKQRSLKRWVCVLLLHIAVSEGLSYLCFYFTIKELSQEQLVAPI